MKIDMNRPQRWCGALFLTCAAALSSGLCKAQTGTPTGAPQGMADRMGSAVSAAWGSATDTQAWLGDGHWRFGVAPFSHHFRYSEEHRYVWAVGLERQRPDGWLAGASYFRNSFGQPSSYVYMGKRWQGLWGQPSLFVQMSAGLLYGYKGKYQNKVPLNVNGFSPGALIGLGWQYSRDASFKAHLLGDAAVMFQLSYDLR